MLENASRQYGKLVIVLSQEQRLLLMRGMGIFAAVLVALLIVGTFYDYQIAQAVYTPGNPFVIFVSTLGLLPMVYPACFLLGVPMQRSLASEKPQALRIIGAAAYMLLAMLFGALITRAVLSTLEGFGGIIGYEPPSTVRFVIGAAIGCILCVLGYKAAKKNDARNLARRVIVVIAALVVTFFAVELVKNFMSRPRPRLVLAGYEGIGFCPWYQKNSGAEGFIASYGIGKDDFKSFPSGHSLMAASLLTSFYGLSLVCPSLRQKLGVALVVEIIFALVVMACRMILGAHFLSDVSMGALVSVVVFIILVAQVKPQKQQS